MKKRLAAIVVCGMLAVSVLTACGGSDSDETEVTEEEVTEYEEEASDETASDLLEDAESLASEGLTTSTEDAMEVEMCSDADFERIQQDYTDICSTYNNLYEFYRTNFGYDEDLENAFMQVKDEIDSYSGISQSDLTAQNAIEIEQEFVNLAELLAEMAQDLT